MATATSLSVSDLWRRYRGPLVAAIPAGVVLGMIVDAALSVNTEHATPQDQLPALFAYACLGAGFALVACIGAGVAVQIGRPRTASTVTPFWRIAAGAGGAVLVGVLVAGTLAVASSDMWGWYSAVAVVAVVTGLIAAVVATAITAFFQFRRRLLP